jgi:hypothetical protein
MKELVQVQNEIVAAVEMWEGKLRDIDQNVLSTSRNGQE